MSSTSMFSLLKVPILSIFIENSDLAWPHVRLCEQLHWHSGQHLWMYHPKDISLLSQQQVNHLLTHLKCDWCIRCIESFNMQTSRQPRRQGVWISGKTLNGMLHIASQIISNSQRNSKIKFEKLVLSCQPVLWSTVYGTSSVVDSHVFMFDMTGNKSCKLLKNRICKTERRCKVQSVLSSLTTRGLLTLTVLLATQTLLVFFQAYNNFILYSTEFHSLLKVNTTYTVCFVMLLERLVKLMDYSEGSFQDFLGHCGVVNHVRFSPSGELLCSTSHSEILTWTVKA